MRTTGVASVAATSVCAPAMAHAQSAPIDPTLAQPEQIRHYEGAFGIAVRPGLQRDELVEEAQWDFYRVIWLSGGYHAPFVGIGGTTGMGGVVYRDPTQPDGHNAAFRFSTGPSVRIGYGATFSGSIVTSPNGDRGNHDYFVTLSFSPMLFVAADADSATLPERSAVVGFRTALTFGAPLWPHRAVAIEDYAVLFSMLVPAVVEISLEVIPGQDAVRPGVMVGWTL